MPFEDSPEHAVLGCVLSASPATHKVDVPSIRVVEVGQDVAANVEAAPLLPVVVLGQRLRDLQPPAVPLFLPLAARPVTALTDITRVG